MRISVARTNMRAARLDRVDYRMEAGHELWQAARRGGIKWFMELVSCERVEDAVDPIGGRTALWPLLLTALPAPSPAAPGWASSILDLHGRPPAIYSSFLNAYTRIALHFFLSYSSSNFHTFHGTALYIVESCMRFGPTDRTRRDATRELPCGAARQQEFA